MSRILVVDDKEMMRDSVATTLARKEHVVVTAGGARDALDKIAKRSFDLVITDLQMPEMDGLEMLAEIRQADEHLPVIFMTAYGTIETAVAAMKQGAFDFITKPFSGDVLLMAVEKAIRHSQLVRENQILRAAADSKGGSRVCTARQMIGSSEMMHQLRDRLAMIADSHGTVLITGESGSGKEVAARAIHEQSPRAGMPFLAVNCAALSTNLLESELFGHEKGAFTGADKLRKGRFELADGGTLLLDEISEVGPEIQAKLLRVLQERTFERVGSSVGRSVDVRVIATTNRDLPVEVATGSFRQDLYFRLNVLPVAMPALRDHSEDIAELAQHFLAEVAAREGRPVKTLEAAAVDVLTSYYWPGNVRELQNICERAAVLTQGDTIHASLIEPWLCHDSVGAGTCGDVIFVSASQSSRSNGSFANMEPKIGSIGSEIVCNGNLTLDDIERTTILATLRHHCGHRQRSAKALGIGVRTLGLKLKRWKELQLVDESV